MGLNEKQKKAAIAITRKLRKDKGFTVKQAELLQGIDDCKQKQRKILEIKKENEESPAVVEEADKAYKQLQKIIDDVNEYMAILHPEGLLDYGSGPTGKVMGQG